MAKEFTYTKQSRGYTLIELLVVIAIIGILASIILLSISSARAKAAYAKAAGDYRALQNALELYDITYNDWPPVNGNIAAFSNQSSWTTLGSLLQSYLGNGILPQPAYAPSYATAVYTYYKGDAHDRLLLPIYNSKTGSFVSCVILDDGYYIDFAFPDQTYVTLNDGGVDPDGIDGAFGQYQYSTDHNNCPGTTVTTITH